MKHKDCFDIFLKNVVNLNSTRIENLKGKVMSVNEYLKTHLEGYQTIEIQGSYAQKTIIKPVDDHEFDSDILLYIKKNEDFQAKDYIGELYNLLKNNGNYRDIVHRRTRCVVLDYAGEFHLDIVPCVEQNGETYICNRDENKFELTDGTGYRDWLSGKNTITNGNLKRATKLLKYLRDFKETFTVKSILLTTLLGNLISDSDSGYDYFNDIPTVLVTISERLNKYLQEREAMPVVYNPVLPKEEFNRHWDQNTYSNFRDKFKLYYNKINDAYESKDHNESVRKWREVFGDAFCSMKKSEFIHKSVIPSKQYGF